MRIFNSTLLEDFNKKFSFFLHFSCVILNTEAAKLIKKLLRIDIILQYWNNIACNIDFDLFHMVCRRSSGVLSAIRTCPVCIFKKKILKFFLMWCSKYGGRRHVKHPMVQSQTVCHNLRIYIISQFWLQLLIIRTFTPLLLITYCM